MKKAKRKIFTLVVALIGVWLVSPVSSAWASEREEALEIIRALIPEVRKESIQRMTSPQAAQAYLNFTKSISIVHTPRKTQPFGCTQQTCTDEQVKAYFHDHISKKIVRAINDIPVIYLESELPKDIEEWFRNDMYAAGLYSPMKNEIYLSLHNIEEMCLSERSIKTVVREEFEHAIDRNIVYRDLFPKTHRRDASMLFALSKLLYETQIRDIIRPEAREWYQADPQELYAKFQLIKTVLRQKHPRLFYSNGNIRRKAVVLFFRSPQSFVDFCEVDLGVVHVLNKSKIKEIQRFIDQLV